MYTESGVLAWKGYQSIWNRYEQKHSSPKYERKYADEPPSDPVECRLRYQGQLFEEETGLYYNRFRYYDPSSCQYLSPDPIGMAGGFRPQAYVHNPLNWVDPLGVTEESCNQATAIKDEVLGESSTKTVAVDLDSNVYAISGMTKDYNGKATQGYDYIFNNELLTNPKRLKDANFPKHEYDQEKFGGKGSYYACHAEIQLILNNPKLINMHVSNKVCDESCIKRLQQIAKFRGYGFNITEHVGGKNRTFVITQSGKILGRN